MVRVSWNQNTGEIIRVESGGGPGEYSDDVAPAPVKEELTDLDQVSEFEVAASVASVYEGNLDLETAVVTTETYSKPNSEDVSTTLAFVEKAQLSDKLATVVCEECSFSAESASDWSSRYREGSRYEYTDWYCPDCGTTIHTEIYESEI